MDKGKRGPLLICLAATMLALPGLAQCPAASSILGATGNTASYGFSAEGIIVQGAAGAPVGSSVATASLGVISFSTETVASGVISGTVTGYENENLDGNVFTVPFGPAYGPSTFNINPDCSGRVTRHFSNGVVIGWDIVVVNAGRKIRYMTSAPARS